MGVETGAAWCGTATPKIYIAATCRTNIAIISKYYYVLDLNASGKFQKPIPFLHVAILISTRKSNVIHYICRC